MRSGLLSLLFPPKCTSCGEMLNFAGLGAEIPALCPSCAKLWESEKLDACVGCGKPVSLCACKTEELQKAGCEEFRKLVFYLQGKRTAVQNRMLFHIKNTPDRRAAEFLAREMAVAVKDILHQGAILPREAALVYIPRGHTAALRTGTDQARKLAYALKAQTGIDVYPAICRRWGRTRTQKRLDLRERRRNAKRAYRLREKRVPVGKTVFLVDDIVTTGSSMAAAARLLRKKGVTRVFCVAVASDDRNKNTEVGQPTFRI